MRVALLDGQDLVPMDPNNLSDPFVEVRYVADDKVVHRIGQTNVIRKVHSAQTTYST